jgi:hypothetical protein
MRQPLLLLAVGGMLFSQTLHGQTFNVLSAEEKAENFQLLFDGTRAGFQQHFVNYIKNDPNTTTLSSEWALDPATQSIGTKIRTEDIRSRRKFRDFELRLDYRCSGNEGIFYRSLLNTDRAWSTGIEVAIDNNTISDFNAPGAAYDLYPPKPNAYQLFNTGKWNSFRLRVIGDSVEHWMNGTQVVGFKLHSPGFWIAYARSKWDADKSVTFKIPGNKAAGYIEEGYLGFQADHGGAWQLRNIRIKEFPPSSVARPILARARQPARHPAFAGLAFFPSADGRWTDASGRNIRLLEAPAIGL